MSQAVSTTYGATSMVSALSAAGSAASRWFSGGSAAASGKRNSAAEPIKQVGAYPSYQERPEARRISQQ